MPLKEKKHTKFTGAAACAIVPPSEGVDVHLAVKEICGSLFSPMELSLSALEQLGKYLPGARLLVYRYKWQVDTHWWLWPDATQHFRRMRDDWQALHQDLVDDPTHCEFV